MKRRMVPLQGCRRIKDSTYHRCRGPDDAQKISERRRVKQQLVSVPHCSLHTASTIWASQAFSICAAYATRRWNGGIIIIVAWYLFERRGQRIPGAEQDIRYGDSPFSELIQSNGILFTPNELASILLSVQRIPCHFNSLLLVFILPGWCTFLDLRSAGYRWYHPWYHVVPSRPFRFWNNLHQHWIYSYLITLKENHFQPPTCGTI